MVLTRYTSNKIIISARVGFVLHNRNTGLWTAFAFVLFKHCLFISHIHIYKVCSSLLEHPRSFHNTLVLTMCHFFGPPLTLQDTSYSPEPHISAEHSQSLLSAQEAVSLWVLGTRKVCILIRLLRDAILTHSLTSTNVAFAHVYDAPIFSIFIYYITNYDYKRSLYSLILISQKIL